MSPSFAKDAAELLGLRSIALGFLLALSLQSAAFYVSFSKTDAASWVVHTLEVENEIYHAFSLIQDLESSQRGYLLTGDEKYLSPYRVALRELDQHLTKLADQTSDNPTQVKNIAQLKRLSAQKIEELNQTISIARSGNLDRALSIVQTDIGKTIMGEIRIVVQKAIDEENRLLDERVVTYERVVSISRMLSSVALIVALVLLIVVTRRGYLLINKSIKEFVEYRDAIDAQLVEARQKAESGIQAKSLFLASMSHEIRTPMTGVVGLTEMLAKTELSKEQQDIVQNMRSTNRVLKTVINDVLDYSRIEAGKLSIEKVPFNLRSTIEEVISTFHPNAVEKGILFDTSFAENVPHNVMGDPTRIRQVLFNLVGNAIKFTAEGHVRIGVTKTPGDLVEFTVTDTGEGIADERTSHLFEAFEQADNTVSRKHGGTGLGLAICRNLVELMGGDITVSSKVDVGSTFQFRIQLPVVDAPIEIPRTREEKNTALKPLKILVAEDVNINQVIIESILTGNGHSCHFADDGQQAVDAVQQDDYDLILMDIRMPNVDGIEAYKRIRAIDSKRCHLPIVALTADVAEDQISKFLEVGFDGVVPKPIDANRLFQSIDRALQEYQTRSGMDPLRANAS